MLCALIMAGGVGKRFWPLSTVEKPKQFLNLIGDRTMIQMTVDRIRPIIPIEKIFVCTGQRYVDLVKEQIPDLIEENIIVEPESRNTAPCIALSAFVIRRYYDDTNLIVLPSDHLICDEDEFRNIANVADEFVGENNKVIITLGMNPTRPEINYGYIRYNEVSKIVSRYRVIGVDRFIEKPDGIKAEKYFKARNYLWNGGIFIMNINGIIEKIRRYMPDTKRIM